MPSSANSYYPSDLPPGLYHLAPLNPDLDKFLRTSLDQLNEPVLPLPRTISDYLVADTVRREVAFDLENQGLTGVELTRRVGAIIDSSPYSQRHQQQSATLSGGEQQLLALTVSLQQSHRFIIGRNCFDFLSPASIAKVRQLLVSHAKCFLEISARDGAELWEFIEGKFHQTTTESSQLANRVPLPSMEPWKLVIGDLKKTFPKSNFMLRIRDLELNTLQVLGIYGENGAGKSTLADCLSEGTSDQLQVEARGLASNSLRWGYLLQQAETPTHGLSVGELLQRFVALGKLAPATCVRLQDWLASSKYYPDLAQADSLTGHRLVISAALLTGEYDLVLLDELTYGLPAAGVAVFLGAIMEAFGPRPLILISHDLKFLSLVCSTILRLKNGGVDGWKT